MVRPPTQGEGEGGPVVTLGAGSDDSGGGSGSDGGGSDSDGERPAPIARRDVAHMGMRRRGEEEPPAAAAAAGGGAGGLSLREQEELALRLLRGKA